MSTKIFGNFPKNTVKVINNKTIVRDVDIDVPSYLNRKTEARTLKRYLKARGGNFDRGLWQPPLVAELPSGKLLLFDGDHRRALWKAAYPQKIKMCAQIVPVKDRAEISRLFVAINKTARQALKPNEVFVHEVFGGDPEATKTRDNLYQCSLKVSLGTGEVGSVVGAQCGPEVPIVGFRHTITSSGLVATRRASTTIIKLWPNEDKIGVELLGGMAMVYKNTPLDAKHSRDFEDFLKVRQAADSKQAEVSQSFKVEGGRHQNYHQKSVAHGILRKFKKWSVFEGRMSKTTFRKYYGTYIKSLEADLT